MSEIWWTMGLIGVPVLVLGREGLARWQQRASDGLLRGLVIWGWLLALGMFLIWAGKDGRLEFGHVPALIYALTFLAGLAAGGEMTRRRRGGVRAVGDSKVASVKASPTPERPLSFMQTIRAQEANLKNNQPPPPEHLPAAPKPVGSHVPPPGMRLELPTSMFAVPLGRDMASSPVELPPAPTRAAASAPGVAPVPAPRRNPARKQIREKVVGVLQAYAGELAQDAPPGPAESTPLAPPAASLPAVNPNLAPPDSPAAFSMPGGPQAPVAPTPVDNFVPSAPPAAYVPPPPPAPSGPVTLGGGFSYKPVLVESRLGGAAPPGQPSA